MIRIRRDQVEKWTQEYVRSQKEVPNDLGKILRFIQKEQKNKPLNFYQKKIKVVINMKDLPGCPKGRMFREDIAGDFFHSMSDDEFLSRKFISYKFTSKEISENKRWFSPVLYV